MHKRLAVVINEHALSLSKHRLRWKSCLLTARLISEAINLGSWAPGGWRSQSCSVCLLQIDMSGYREGFVKCSYKLPPALVTHRRVSTNFLLRPDLSDCRGRGNFRLQGKTTMGKAGLVLLFAPSCCSPTSENKPDVFYSSQDPIQYSSDPFWRQNISVQSRPVSITSVSLLSYSHSLSLELSAVELHLQFPLEK